MLDALLAYVVEENRVCPQPDRWNRLWKMLPQRERVGGSWNPSPPLILAAWHVSSAHEKRNRLREHIEYAATHGVLTQIDAFLRALDAREWSYEDGRGARAS